MSKLKLSALLYIIVAFVLLALVGWYRLSSLDILKRRSKDVRVIDKDATQSFPKTDTLKLQSENVSVVDAETAHYRRLTSDMLDESLALGKNFLLNNQKPEGNFTYEYNFVTRELTKGDSQARQAGALWGLVLIHHNNPSEETKKAIERGLAFFDRNSKQTQDGQKYTVYPGDRIGYTHTVALLALALVDFLRSEESLELREKYEQDLDRYIKFLLSLRMDNGHFHQSYRLEDGNGFGLSSPYSDGESLLALVKAAKYAGYTGLKAIILASAEKMYQRNVQQALTEDSDSTITKGFYQWSSMAYYELYTSGWGIEVEKYAQRVIDLAYWMIDIHETLERMRNTAYAHEGLISAWELARLTNDRYAMVKIGYVIDVGLYKLTSWQVDGPLKNKFLREHKTDDLMAIGGVMNSKDDPRLRIDVTQHQMHAVMLALRYIYQRKTISTVEQQPFTAGLETSGFWFEDIQSPIWLTPSDKEMLVRFVAMSILQREEGEEEISEALKQDILPRIVFLSVSDGIAPARVVVGRARGIVKAIQQAISRVHTLCEKGYTLKWIKLDVVENVYLMGDVDFNKPLINLERGLEGIAFDIQSRIAFLPQELLIYRLVDSEKKIRPNNIANYLEGDAFYSQQFLRLRGLNKAKMYRFTTISIFTDGDEIIPLYRGHRLFNQISKDELLSAARLAGQYLTRAVGPDGKFVYLYRPRTDSVSKSYNILRHAGTVYSMLELYEVTGEEELLRAARRAIKYLLLSIKPCGAEKKDMSCVVEFGYVKLGGNALAVIALAKYIEITQDREYMPVLLRLSRWIQNVQKEDGEFFIHMQRYPGGEIDSIVSQYYPGEALLAMMRIYALDPNESWLDTAEKTAQYLINVRDVNLPLSKLTQDHWLLYGLNELYRYRPNPLYLNHALRITQAMIQNQNRDPIYRDWLGGYGQHPRSTHAAVRAEGLCAAYSLAYDFFKPQEAETILQSIRLGIAFQLQTQFYPESVLYLKHPQRALGGFHGSLTDFEIRNDYVQHNLSGLLGLYRIEAKAAGDVKKRAINQYSFLFVGDTSFGENYQLLYKTLYKTKENILDTEGYDYPMEKLSSILLQSDAVIANLETPITNMTESPFASKKEYIHWTDVGWAPQYLKKYNIKTVSLANNHTLDYGLPGLRETLDVLGSNNMEWFGAGFNEREAAKPYLKELRVGEDVFTLAVITAFEYRENYDRDFNFYAQGDVGGVNMLSIEKISRQIRELKATMSGVYVVVFPHWGKNYRWKSAAQVQLAHKIIDAGADLIIGHGTHMMQEIEKYHGRWIFYNIGNFMFNSQGRYQKFNIYKPFSLVIQLLLRERNGRLGKTIKIYPIFTDNLITRYQSRFLTRREFGEAYRLVLTKSPSQDQLNKDMKIGMDDIGMFMELPVE